MKVNLNHAAKLIYQIWCEVIEDKYNVKWKKLNLSQTIVTDFNFLIEFWYFWILTQLSVIKNKRKEKKKEWKLTFNPYIKTTFRILLILLLHLLLCYLMAYLKCLTDRSYNTHCLTLKSFPMIWWNQLNFLLSSTEKKEEKKVWNFSFNSNT